MSASIPENYLDLFKKKAFGSLTTLMPDGSPRNHAGVGGLRGRQSSGQLRFGPPEGQERPQGSPRGYHAD